MKNSIFITEAQALTWGNSLYLTNGKPYKEEYAAGKINAVAYYCGNSHIRFNSHLRSSNHEQLYDFELQKINELKQIILDAPRTDRCITVWRMVSDDIVWKIMKNNFLHDSFTECGFLSTSLTQESCWDNFNSVSNMNFMLRINVPKGTAGIYTPCYTINRCEQEFLIYPEAQLKFRAYSQSNYKGNKIRIVDLDLIHGGIANE